MTVLYYLALALLSVRRWSVRRRMAALNHLDEKIKADCKSRYEDRVKAEAACHSPETLAMVCEANAELARLGAARTRLRKKYHSREICEDQLTKRIEWMWRMVAHPAVHLGGWISGCVESWLAFSFGGTAISAVCETTRWLTNFIA